MGRRVFTAKYHNGHITVWLVERPEPACDVIRFELVATDRADADGEKKVGVDLAVDEALFLAFGLFKAAFSFLGRYTERLRQIHLNKEER